MSILAEKAAESGAPVGAGAAARPSAAGRLEALCDPEWLWFLGVALLPAALCLALGEGRKATFFLGAAVYLAVLKWLGWAVFGRFSGRRPAFVLFAADLFAGLAVVTAWFYLRNLLALAWPASYGLRELAWLFPALLALHGAVAVRQAVGAPRRREGWRTLSRQALSRAAAYAPFVGTLAIILWRVGGTLYPQTVDPIFHACAARAYTETGLFRPHPFLLGALSGYPSGFGAVNAAAVSVAPLSPAQAVNLQHVLWQVTAVYLLVGSVVLLAGRRLRAAGLLPLAFLLAVPLYSLYPDNCYSGTPRQAAVAMFAAVAVLPLLAPTQPRRAFVTAGVVVASLGVIAAAMNPACVPFAGLALLAALAVFVVRGREAFGRAAPGPVALQVGLAAAFAVLVLVCDPYYGARLARVESPAPATRVEQPATREADPTSSPAKGRPQGRPSLPAVLAGRLFVLSANGTVTGRGLAEEYLAWPERLPYAAFPAVTLAAVATAVALVLVRRRRGLALPDAAPALVRFLAGCAAVWLVSKSVILALCWATADVPGEGAQLLSPYLGFLLLRWELLLLFAAAVGAGTLLYLLGEQAGRKARLLARMAWLAALVLLGQYAASAAWPRCGDVVMTTGRALAVTPDDLALVSWCDEHLPREKGLIGMAAGVGRAGPHNEEQLVTGLGGMSAFLLYGKHGNYRFTMNSLEGEVAADYLAHVHDTFDAGWCRKNGIRYFYATPEGLRQNPGLAAAVADGRLRKKHAVGESVLYEVVP